VTGGVVYPDPNMRAENQIMMGGVPLSHERALALRAPSDLTGEWDLIGTRMIDGSRIETTAI
jgi:hypothetical protein